MAVSHGDMTTVDPDSTTRDLELDDGSPRYLTATIACSAPDYTSQLNLSNTGAVPLGFKVHAAHAQLPAREPQGVSRRATPRDRR